MTEEELEELLDIFKGHRNKECVQEFLKSKGLHSSGTWEGVQERIKDYVGSDELTEKDLLELLDTIEAYGAKHFFLFEASDEQIRRLGHPNHIIGSALKMGHVMPNSAIFVNMPDEPTLVSIRRTESEVTLKWVHKRSWIEFVDEDDDGRFINRKFERKASRGVAILRVELKTKKVDIRLNSHIKAKYGEELADIRNRASPYIMVSNLEPILLQPAIRVLLDGDEVRQRRTQISTSQGTLIELTSSGEDQTFVEDDFFLGGMEKAGDACVGKMANVYWLPDKSNGNLSSEVHTVIYDTNEVAFAGTSTDRGEVEYVLQRIRMLASVASGITGTDLQTGCAG